ncbi:hypothetical protein AX16_009280 [Volvariella volvacea WC 439]|nr:hypothetical protein AX16_009280 [Volvariella volvacea WC 439]
MGCLSFLTRYFKFVPRLKKHRSVVSVHPEHQKTPLDLPPDAVDPDICYRDPPPYILRSTIPVACESATSDADMFGALSTVDCAVEYAIEDLDHPSSAGPKNPMKTLGGDDPSSFRDVGENEVDQPTHSGEVTSANKSARYSETAMPTNCSYTPKDGSDSSTAVISTHAMRGKSFAKLHEGQARDLLLVFVVVDAMHTGKVRADPLECHPNTRQAIILDITTWIENKTRERGVLWLLGPPGIGKSAIAMSAAKRLAEPNSRARVAASFFFYRADPRRNSAHYFVPTIAYQLAVSFKDVGTVIDRVIEEDPLVLHAMLEVQWRKLIIEPIKTVSDVPPAVVIIDGLDECEDVREQGRVLELVSSCGFDFPLAFLISSRPEAHLVNSFNSDPLVSHCRTSIDLAQCKDVSEMRLFMRSQFSRIYSRHQDVLHFYSLCGVWPTDDVVDLITSRADGQFIYPVTLFKYIDDEDTNPHERLQSYLEQSPGAHSYLDALYIHIMRSSQESQDARLKDLLFLICTLQPNSEAIEMPLKSTSNSLLSSYWHAFEPTLGRLASLIYQTRVRCRLAIRRLRSVLSIPSSDDGVITIHHKSFSDFLFDQQRSEEYHINPRAEAIRIIVQCLNKLEHEVFDEPWFLLSLWWRCSVPLFGSPSEDLLLRLKKIDFHEFLHIMMQSGPWAGFEADYGRFLTSCESWNDHSLVAKFDSRALAHAVFADWLRANYSRVYLNDEADHEYFGCPLSWNALLALAMAYVRSYNKLEGTRAQVDAHTWLESMSPNNVVLASLTVFTDSGLLGLLNQDDLAELSAWSKGWMWNPGGQYTSHNPRPQWAITSPKTIEIDIFNLIAELPREYHYHERNADNVSKWLTALSGDLAHHVSHILSHWEAQDCKEQHGYPLDKQRN